MSTVQRLRISATAHGINYLPEYYAAATGLFDKHGLSIDNSPRDPWTGVLDDLESDQADIALGGLWVPAMYAASGRGLIAIGQVNARFPMVVLARDEVTGFDWTWLAEKTVLVPGAGGTAPYEFTAGLMRAAGAAPSRSRFVRDLSTAMLTELWLTGLGDAYVTDLLTGMTLSHSGNGHIALRHAAVGGAMPNSVYYVKASRLSELRDRLVQFMSAMTEAMQQLDGAAAVDDALALASDHWPDSSSVVLRSCLEDLMANGTWSSTRIEAAACERWTGMLYEAGLVQRPVTYEQIVDPSIIDAVFTAA